MANGLFDAMMGAREPSPGAALEEARLLALQDLALPGRVSPDRLNRTIDAALEQTPPPAAGNPWLQSAATAANIGLGLLPITRVGRALSATVPRTLATLGGVGALNAAAAMPAEARPPEALQPLGQAPPGLDASGPGESEGITTARGVVRRLRVQQEALTEELAGLRQQAEMFNPQRLNPGSNSEDIKAAQRILKGLNLYQRGIDGIWSDGTARAVESYLKGIEQRRQAVQGQLTELTTQLGGENATLQGLLRDERVNRLRGEIGPIEQFVRDNPMVVGGLAGAALGPAWRGLAARGVNRNRQQDIAAANQLLRTGAPDDPARVANVNAFYERGGGRPQFRIDRNEPLGFAAAADQAPDATRLYPTGGRVREYVRTPDVARLGSFGAGWGISENRYAEAQRQVEAALERERQNPSESNIRDRMAAERQMAAFDVGRRAAQGAIASYIPASVFMRYRPIRADSQLAEAEVMRLNRLLAQNQPQRPDWRAPRVDDITLKQNKAGRYYHSTTGNFASDAEVADYQRMVQDLERERRRRR